MAWQQESEMDAFERLEAARLAPNGLSLVELFALADELAANGRFDEKKEVVLKIVPLHPDYIQNVEAQVRVKTYRYDLVRRDGRPIEALKGLHAVAISSVCQPMAIALYLQAIGQCYLKQLPEQGQPIAAAALFVQRKIFALDGYGEFPVDKQLYFIETIIDMKLRLYENDDELSDFLEEYNRLLEDLNEDDSFRPRAIGMLLYYIGQYKFLNGDHAAAAKSMSESLEHFPSDRNLAMSGLLGLSYLAPLSNWSKDDPQVIELRNAFVDNHNKLLQTDVDEFRTEYRGVCEMLGVETLFV